MNKPQPADPARPRLPQHALPLESLRVFEAVARLRSFGGAADEVHLTQPAVSRRIQSLEASLGAQLFQRGPRHVDLTPAGHALLAATQAALAQVDRAVRQIRAAQSRPQVDITTYASFATLWLLPRLASFHAAHPDIDLRLSTSDALVDPETATHDLALRRHLTTPPAAGSVRLFSEVLTPVASRLLLAKGPALRRPADLARHTLLADEYSRFDPELLGWPGWLQQHGVPALQPRRWLRSSYTHQLVQAAMAGQGIALVGLGLVHEALARGELVEPFGAAGRMATEAAYWMLPLAGTAPKAAMDALVAWLGEQAEATRAAIAKADAERA